MLLAAGRTLAQKNGIMTLTHAGIARNCTHETSISTVRRHFPTLPMLREAVARSDDTLREEYLSLGFKL